MTVKPSTIARVSAVKRARKRNLATGASGKRAPINNMDVMKALDRESARADMLEKKVNQLNARLLWLERAFAKAVQ